MKYNKKYFVFLLIILSCLLIFYYEKYRINQDVIQITSNSQLSPNQIESKKKKFMIYECTRPCGGWGDRIRGLISTYAWSLITDREIIINITHPCKFEELVVPNEINWNRSITDLIANRELASNFTSFEFSKENKHYLMRDFYELDLVNFESDKDVIFVRVNYELNIIFKKIRL